MHILRFAVGLGKGLAINKGANSQAHVRTVTSCYVDMISKDILNVKDNKIRNKSLHFDRKHTFVYRQANQGQFLW